MALIECADCHKPISVAAIKCPNCGRPTNLPTDEQLSEIHTRARREAKRAGIMALLWCAVFVGVGSLSINGYVSMNIGGFIQFWAIIAACYQIYQRMKFKSYIQQAESAGVQGKDI